MENNLLKDVHFISGTGRSFWKDKKKLYELSDCPCGGTQDMNEIRVLYTGYGDYGAWNVYCNCCMRYARAETELEAVKKWNERVRT